MVVKVTDKKGAAAKTAAEGKIVEVFLKHGKRHSIGLGKPFESGIVYSVTEGTAEALFAIVIGGEQKFDQAGVQQKKWTRVDRSHLDLEFDPNNIPDDDDIKQHLEGDKDGEGEEGEGEGDSGVVNV